MERFFSRECAFMLAAAIAVMVTLFALPVITLLIASFQDNSGLNPAGTYSGITNYSNALSAPAFRQSTWPTAVFTLSAVAVQVSIAFLAALLTRRDFPLVGVARTILIAPYFLPTVVVVVAWRFFSDPFVGPLPNFIRMLGFPPPDFRGPDHALLVMVIVATYEAVPFTYVVLLARLFQVPQSLYEVAELDGASPHMIFRQVTWPAVRNPLGLLVVLRILITWLKFDVPWLVYCQQATSPEADTISVNLYRTAFENLQFGQACAASVWLLTTIVFVYGVYRIAFGAQN